MISGFLIQKIHVQILLNEQGLKDLHEKESLSLSLAYRGWAAEVSRGAFIFCPKKGMRISVSQNGSYFSIKIIDSM